MVALLGSSVVDWIVGDIDDDTREVVADGVADGATVVVAWTKN